MEIRIYLVVSRMSEFGIDHFMHTFYIFRIDCPILQCHMIDFQIFAINIVKYFRGIISLYLNNADV